MPDAPDLIQAVRNGPDIWPSACYTNVQTRGNSNRTLQLLREGANLSPGVFKNDHYLLRRQPERPGKVAETERSRGTDSDSTRIHNLTRPAVNPFTHKR